MSGPVRWKDDPALRAQTGIDLRDEELLVGDYDLERVRAGISGGGTPGPGGGGLAAAGAAAASLGVAALAVLAVWGASSPAADTDVLAMIDAATEEVVHEVVAADDAAGGLGAVEEVAEPESGDTVEVEAVAVEAVGGPAPVADVEVRGPDREVPPPDPADAPPRDPGEGPPSAPDRAEHVVGAHVEEAPTPDVDALDAASDGDDGLADVEPHLQTAEPGPPGPPGRLAEEVAVVAAARAALDEGDPATALQRYRDYLAAWPDGHLRQEALFAVLESLVALERWDAVAQLSARLAAAPELAPRRQAIVAVRAEALVALGRCDEAEALAEQLDRAAAGAVRQRCRQRR